MRLVKSQFRREIDVRESIAIGEREHLIIRDMLQHALETAARLGLVASVHERDAPGLGAFSVDLHRAGCHVEGHIGHVQKIIREKFLNEIALVTQTQHELVEAVSGVHLHYVPQNRPSADFDHWLGPHRGLFGEARSQAPRSELQPSSHRSFEWASIERGRGGRRSGRARRPDVKHIAHDRKRLMNQSLEIWALIG
jgi:hypothetical protein